MNLVYADGNFRGSGDAAASPPVAVGRWMVAQGLFSVHSVDRNDAGDRWAQAVGGEIPERDQQGNDESSERNGAAALQRLNEVDWPRDVVEALDVSATGRHVD